MDRKIEALNEARPIQAFSNSKSMGVQPEECIKDRTFTLASHQV